MWEGGGTIDKGVLACGKGNRGAGAWVARVRVSAHTVWRWSSFPLRKLPMNHMLPVPRSLQMCHSPLRRRSSRMKRRSSPMRRHNFPKCRTFLVLHRNPMRHMSGVLYMSLVVQGLWWKQVPVWLPVEAEVVVEDWCRHTGGTGTVAGTVDTVGTDAFVGSILYMTLSQN